mmetsp:Transcript_16921/g.43104  ORF Transcript_16921/g.43104 Transcript_16921/m.43104 type:complete len:132 (-) Transcript_16921:90-485(-)
MMVSSAAVDEVYAPADVSDGAQESSTVSEEEGRLACVEDVADSQGVHIPLPCFGGMAAPTEGAPVYVSPKWPTARHQRGRRGGKRHTKAKQREVTSTQAAKVPEHPAYINLKDSYPSFIGDHEEVIIRISL